MELEILYDKTAKNYDELYAEEQKKKYRYVMRGFKCNARAIADLGCGTGLFFEQLSKVSRYVVGLDPSFEMLKVAMKRRNHKVDLVLGFAEDLPIKSRSLDAAVAITVLQNVADREKLYKELLIAVKGGGTVVLTFLKKAVSYTHLTLPTTERV